MSADHILPSPSRPGLASAHLGDSVHTAHWSFILWSGFVFASLCHLSHRHTPRERVLDGHLLSAPPATRGLPRSHWSPDYCSRRYGIAVPPPLFCFLCVYKFCVLPKTAEEWLSIPRTSKYHLEAQESRCWLPAPTPKRS